MQQAGKILWCDLTVENAEEVKDFYCQVVGWKSTNHDMGEYNDYNVYSPGADEPVAGICHSKGVNKHIPPQWLNYVAVENLDESLEKCRAMGGEVVDGPRLQGSSSFAVIKDPAGAFMALYQEG